MVSISIQAAERFYKAFLLCVVDKTVRSVFGKDKHQISQ